MTSETEETLDLLAELRDGESIVLSRRGVKILATSGAVQVGRSFTVAYLRAFDAGAFTLARLAIKNARKELAHNRHTSPEVPK